MRCKVGLILALALMIIISIRVYGGGLPQAIKDRQKTAEEVQLKPRHEVTVAVKLVQVYVTDKNGKPAGELTADDFEIYDNNKPVPVLHFEKHFVEEAGEEAPVKKEPAINRKFFLFFDLAFTDARGLVRARNAALKFMEKNILPTDEISFLTYSSLKGLTLHEYLTRDHQRIRQLVGNLGLRNVTGRAETLSSFFYSDMLMSFQTDQAGTAAEESFFTQQARLQTGKLLDTTRRQGYVDQARFYLEALTNLARALRIVPGYKNIILFSAGLAKQLLFGRTGGAVVGDWTTPEQFAAQVAEYDAAQADAGLRSDFTRLLKELKNANCAVFAVDISRIHKEISVEESLEPINVARELDGSDSLKLLAAETGGKFYANTINPENAMEEIVNSTKNYYILGFKVDDRWDGKYHKVKVKVKKKGYNVYSQAGYFNPKPFKDYDNFEKLLHLIEIALADEPWPFRPVEFAVKSLNLVENGLNSVLTFARAGLKDTSEVIGNKTEAYFLLFNERGDLVLIKKFRVVVQEKEKQENDLFLPSFLVPLRPGKYDTVVVMRNMDNGLAARGKSSIEIPDKLPVMPYLDQPLLLSLYDRAMEICAGGEPSMASVYGYNAGTYSAVAGQLPEETRRIYVALRLACPAGWEEGIIVGASLSKENDDYNQELPVAILQKKRSGQLVKLLLELNAGELSRGNYVITFTVEGPNFVQPLKALAHFSI